MPDPSAFVTVNGPQGANYAGPMVGFQIGDHLAALPEQYYQARMRAARYRSADGTADERSSTRLESAGGAWWH
jgi:hypothetical protein